jgi:hypothetical protein
MQPEELECLIAATLATDPGRSPKDMVTRYRMMLAELQRTGGIRPAQNDQPEQPKVTTRWLGQ